MKLKLKLKLVKRPDSVDGYWYPDVVKFMEEEKLINEWNKWFCGQTGVLLGKNDDGGKVELLVYKYDVDRFLEWVGYEEKEIKG